MGLRIEDNSKRFERESDKAMDSAVGRMAKDVKQISQVKVPFKKGDLQKSADIEDRGIAKRRVSYDKKYASYQERGERADGGHKVRKYSTPGTGKNYLSDAGETVGGNAVQYFKQAKQLIRL